MKERQSKSGSMKLRDSNLKFNRFSFPATNVSGEEDMINMQEKGEILWYSKD
jgi:hypothetical protein